MRTRVLRLSALLQRHGQIEMRVRVVGIERKGIAVTDFGIAVAAVVVVDVAEIEVRFEI